MISCKEYVEIRKKELREQISILNKNNRVPHLGVIQIGSNDASERYVKGKKKDCEEVGIVVTHLIFKDYSSYDTNNLKQVINDMCDISNCDGIIVQLPIPDKFDVEELQNAIPAEKDVDGFRRDSMFIPCTPKGMIDYLEYNNVNLSGELCVVIGRSKIVGKPMVNLLIDRGATVICCNSKTKDLKTLTQQAKIVVSAVGKPEIFDFSYFNESQILLDVGINLNASGKLCGDISRDVKDKVTHATPVPGGVGLLTRLALLENTFEAYKMNMGGIKC